MRSRRVFPFGSSFLLLALGSLGCGNTSSALDSAGGAAGQSTMSGGSGADPTTGGSHTGGSKTSTGGSSSSGGSGPSCNDACSTARAGVQIGCKKRFLFGVNYPWRLFSGDFGGGDAGVAANAQTISSQFQDLHAGGVSVIRWWMFPHLDGGGIALDGGGLPTGLAGTTVADIHSALDLAAQAGVYLQLTLFSFDNFDVNPNLKPVITSDSSRAKLVSSVINPVLSAVLESSNADRVNSWDVINEPEWAVSGSDPYGDQDFTPSTAQTVGFSQMERFISDVTTAIHARTSAAVTVGGATLGWAKAWSHTGLDFYTFHDYDWSDQWWPFSTPPGHFGTPSGKPVVLGEFPLSGLSGNALGSVLDGIFAAGYAGAMPWAVTDHCCGRWSEQKATMKAFADAHGCTTQF